MIIHNPYISGTLEGTASYAITASYAENGGGGGGNWTQFTTPTMSYGDSSSLSGLSITNEAFQFSIVETVQREGIDDDTFLFLTFDTANVVNNIPIDLTGRHTLLTGSTGPIYDADIWKFGDQSANLVGSNTSYLTVPYTASDYNLTQSAFTIDFWIYPKSIGRYQSVYSQGVNANNRAYCIISTDNRINLTCLSASATPTFNATSSIIPNYAQDQWFHIAVVKKPFADPNQVMFFVNGQLISAMTSSLPWTNLTSENRIFTTYYPTTTTTNTSAYIDELRYSTIARWTESFGTLTTQYESHSEERRMGAIGNEGNLTGYNVSVTASAGIINVRKLTYGTSTNIKFNILAQ